MADTPRRTHSKPGAIPRLTDEPAPDELFVAGHDPADMKLGTVVRRVVEGEDPGVFRAAIIGFRSDIGIVRNGGRPGAAEGPTAIRRALYRLNATDARTGTELARFPTADLGDVVVAGEDLDAAQQRLGHAVGTCLSAGVVPIVLGGGHETAYGHFLGYVDAGRPLAIVNLDAHLDVREVRDGLATSGTPFRQALEHKSGLLGGHYICVGAQPFANAPRYAEWARARGAFIEWFDEVRLRGVAACWGHHLVRHARKGVMVTLDMDSVSSAWAPGTSAASPLGFTAEEFLAAAQIAGRSSVVTSFDISEVSPPLDRDGQTARLAALAVYRFLCARAEAMRGAL